MEIDNAYKRAVALLSENSITHKVLIDALLKFKTLGTTLGFIEAFILFLDTDEIDLIMKGKGLSAIERSRKDQEAMRKENSPVLKVPES